MNMQSVRTLPLHRPVILHTSHTIQQVAHAMRSQNIGSVLINSADGGLLGIVTDRDLAFAMALKDIRGTDKIDKLLGFGKLVAVTENATLQDVIGLMREEGIRRVPVIRDLHGERQKCIGVVTLDDLVTSNLIDMKQCQAIISAQFAKSLPERSKNRNPVRTAFRHQDRRQHSYHRFISQISADTGLSRGEARNLTLYAITAVLRNVPATEGKNLLSQLPFVLQAELVSEISYNEPPTSMDEVIKEIAGRLNKNEIETRALLRRFWQSLKGMTALSSAHNYAL